MDIMPVIEGLPWLPGGVLAPVAVSRDESGRLGGELDSGLLAQAEKLESMSILVLPISLAIRMK